MSEYSISFGSRASMASSDTMPAAEPTSLSVRDVSNGSSQRSAIVAPGSRTISFSGRRHSGVADELSPTRRGAKKSGFSSKRWSRSTISLTAWTDPSQRLPSGRNSVRSSSTSTTRPHWSGTRWIGSSRSLRTTTSTAIELPVDVTWPSTARPSWSPESETGSALGAHADNAMSATARQDRTASRGAARVNACC